MKLVDVWRRLRRRPVGPSVQRMPLPPEARFLCRVGGCERLFDSAQALQQHITARHKPTVRPYYPSGYPYPSPERVAEIRRQMREAPPDEWQEFTDNVPNTDGTPGEPIPEGITIRVWHHKPGRQQG